ncbi:4-(cytidine 5'-diphospho)-2-C-methyl-D-erythritol kinase [Candidatus Thioglobus sp.]|uniref:4-(cytidine 5'-diphospho)-2-C-methyl-D-erythritol kinase n=1 Tax=Candidatus Thioglobus sp. TaxID=2026721 RepID=UPI001D7BA415|nr:4-(cytidine 5'-diphospho)-2-C-methyl-D-erythritol kinase [Candidatus Thioglobus sp.]MBT3277398.1 4-(cytidine 5'-diphospho)-2-C-methyl-D-erythritol kinase [Candidatus Thioglobus sp.]MBT3446577.1 4-(cytidine 5'-diphospho)-2-C-methyl-D-erythritol kinase [Candidatus Thioglobus sp.]MBT3744501.1 4-(cytidine 5'-diphospho)-2-C-methyl-D-erythritol kinase [Candidatus Thioglobus sp.]MBT4001085.1 4-(cytidine 5'-diphospho)-2-C-methyl-D-erythritol kinase [Candidatus Thioglobus sp.]MBT4315788.1 4-(cytidin
MSNATKVWLAPAKINLFLHINSKREDGYHNLQTIFQLLDYYDELQFSITSNGVINRATGNANIAPESDLIIRAAKLLQEKSQTSLGCDISIVKRIPAGGGLGGGSSDAATTLVALNHLWKTNLDQQALMELGLKLGADVPIFINAQSAWAEGVGEILSPLKTPNHYFLVVFVNQHTSTSEIFSHKALTMSPMIGKISDFSELANTHNDCLLAAIEQTEEIRLALEQLDRCSDLIGKARMSGTGSCVFAEFATKKYALAALEKMPKKWMSFTAQAINTSPILKWAVAKR